MKLAVNQAVEHLKVQLKEVVSSKAKQECHGLGRNLTTVNTNTVIPIELLDGSSEIRKNDDVFNGYHISLSRTFVLLRFQIDPFMECLRKSLSAQKRCVFRN